MTEKQLEKATAYLDAIIALCGHGDEKHDAIRIIATDLSNYLFNNFGATNDEVS
jgi:hypothetical protein